MKTGMSFACSCVPGTRKQAGGAEGEQVTRWVRDPGKALSCRAFRVIVKSWDFILKVIGSHCRVGGGNDIRSLCWTNYDCC